LPRYAGLTSCFPSICGVVSSPLLRTSRLNPRLSAEEHLNGTFDFNCTPLAPLGTKVILHKTPQQRRTWAPHSVEGWYVGYAPEHYRCYMIHVTSTNKTRIGTTVEFFPTHCRVPQTSSADYAVRAALELIAALENPSPASPLAPLGLRQLEALRQLAELLASALPPTAATSPRVPSPAMNTRAVTRRVEPDPEMIRRASPARPTAVLPAPVVAPVVAAPLLAATTPAALPRVPPVTPDRPRFNGPLVRPQHHYPTRARAPPAVT
jgi:hypothetical protein